MLGLGIELGLSIIKAEMYFLLLLFIVDVVVCVV